MDLTVSKAELPREKEVVDKFLTKHFFRTSIVEAFGLGEEKPPPIPDCAEFVIKAVDSQGQLAGVAFNTTKPTDLWRPRHSDKERRIVEFFKYIERESKIFELPDNTVELWLLAVDPGWRRRGVARQLVEGSVREARSCGFVAMSMICVGDHVASLARSQGWEELYRSSFTDYISQSGIDKHIKLLRSDINIYLYFKQL